MIVFNLRCKSCSYVFEAWFSSSKEYGSQQKNNLVLCPNCNSSLVTKSLMTPSVSKKSNMKVLDTTGLVFNPLLREWFLNKKMIKINYFCTAQKI